MARGGAKRKNQKGLAGSKRPPSGDADPSTGSQLASHGNGHEDTPRRTPGPEVPTQDAHDAEPGVGRNARPKRRAGQKAEELLRQHFADATAAATQASGKGGFRPKPPTPLQAGASDQEDTHMEVDSGVDAGGASGGWHSPDGARTGAGDGAAVSAAGSLARCAQAVIQGPDSDLIVSDAPQSGGEKLLDALQQHAEDRRNAADRPAADSAAGGAPAAASDGAPASGRPQRQKVPTRKAQEAAESRALAAKTVLGVKMKYAIGAAHRPGSGLASYASAQDLVQAAAERLRRGCAAVSEVPRGNACGRARVCTIVELQVVFDRPLPVKDTIDAVPPVWNGDYGVQLLSDCEAVETVAQVLQHHRKGHASTSPSGSELSASKIVGCASRSPTGRRSRSPSPQRHREKKKSFSHVRVQFTYVALHGEGFDSNEAFVDIIHTDEHCGLVVVRPLVDDNGALVPDTLELIVQFDRPRTQTAAARELGVDPEAVRGVSAVYAQEAMLLNNSADESSVLLRDCGNVRQRPLSKSGGPRQRKYAKARLRGEPRAVLAGFKKLHCGAVWLKRVVEGGCVYTDVLVEFVCSYPLRKAADILVAEVISLEHAEPGDARAELKTARADAKKRARATTKMASHTPPVPEQDEIFVGDLSSLGRGMMPPSDVDVAAFRKAAAEAHPREMCELWRGMSDVHALLGTDGRDVALPKVLEVVKVLREQGVKHLVGPAEAACFRDPDGRADAAGHTWETITLAVCMGDVFGVFWRRNKKDSNGMRLDMSQEDFQRLSRMSGFYLILTQVFRVEPDGSEVFVGWAIWYVGGSDRLGERLNDDDHPAADGQVWFKGTTVKTRRTMVMVFESKYAWTGERALLAVDNFPRNIKSNDGERILGSALVEIPPPTPQTFYLVCERLRARLQPGFELAFRELTKPLAEKVTLKDGTKTTGFDDEKARFVEWMDNVVAWYPGGGLANHREVRKITLSNGSKLCACWHAFYEWLDRPETSDESRGAPIVGEVRELLEANLKAMVGGLPDDPDRFYQDKVRQLATPIGFAAEEPAAASRATGAGAPLSPRAPVPRRRSTVAGPRSPQRGAPAVAAGGSQG